LPSYFDQSVVRIRPSACQRWKVGVPGIGTTMLIVATSTLASSRNSTVRRKMSRPSWSKPNMIPRCAAIPCAWSERISAR
jgi:hypothetical protein